MIPLIELLVRLRALLERVPDEVYIARAVPALSGSVGGHVRHCLDHVTVFATLATRYRISYDHRLRSTPDETMRQAAIERIDALVDELAALEGASLEADVTVSARLDTVGVPLSAASSVARELAFVVQHTIHHFAVIALLLDRMGVAVPPQFAHAPSTLKAA